METINKIPIGSRRFVNPQEVILLRAAINYTNVDFSNGSKMIVATTLKELEKRFSGSPMFFGFTNHFSSIFFMSINMSRLERKRLSK